MKRQNYRIYGKANERDIFIKTRSSDLLGHYLFTICKPFARPQLRVCSLWLTKYGKFLPKN